MGISRVSSRTYRERPGRHNAQSASIARTKICQQETLACCRCGSRHGNLLCTSSTKKKPSHQHSSRGNQINANGFCGNPLRHCVGCVCARGTTADLCSLRQSDKYISRLLKFSAKMFPK